MTNSAKEMHIIVRVDASRSLEWLNDQLPGLEGSGPLIEMKLDNDKSSFTFDALRDRPGKPVELSRQVGGVPQVPDGAVLVASGRIFIEGEQVLCAATRGP